MYPLFFIFTKIKIMETIIIEKIKVSQTRRVHKDTSGDYVLSACPENMDLLMQKINELVNEVKTLKVQVTILEKTKAKKPLICGPRY
jgi:hypothetical protein